MAHHFIFIQAGQVEEKDDGLTIVDVEKKLKVLSDNLSNAVRDLIEASTSGCPPTELNAKLENLVKLVTANVEQSIDTTCRLKEPTTQQAIVTANKEIGEAAIQLISAVRDAHRRPNNATTVAMMGAVQSTIQNGLLSSMGIIHEASQNLIRAEKELKAIQAKIQDLVDIMPILENQYDFTPEVMIQSSRDVIAATAGIVLATTQDAVIDNCKKAHDNMETLIKFSRAASEQEHIDKATQEKVKKALKNAGEYVTFKKPKKLDQIYENSPKIFFKILQNSPKFFFHKFLIFFCTLNHH